MQVIVTEGRLSFGDRRVLEGVDATFNNARVTALVGPSGSGKSTLLAVMAGYQRLDSGNVSFVNDDGEFTAPDPALVAWVPQGANALGTRTALDNVMIAPLAEGRGLAASHTIAERALTDVGLLSRANAGARVLSGGELQRVSFARALATSKPLIFADEPSASLDAANTYVLAELLIGLRSRATIIVATHDPILINAAEAVVSLRSEHTNAA